MYIIFWRRFLQKAAFDNFLSLIEDVKNSAAEIFVTEFVKNENLLDKNKKIKGL